MKQVLPNELPEVFGEYFFLFAPLHFGYSMLLYDVRKKNSKKERKPTITA